MKGAASFTISLCDLMACSKSLPTTAPPPSVAGPPTNKSARAGADGHVAARSVAAHAMAVPVHRAGLHSGSAGKESRCNPSRIADSVNSHSDKGAKNFCEGWFGWPFDPGCWPFISPRVPGPPPWNPEERPPNSCELICAVLNSLLPRNTYVFWHSANPNSCTCACVPKVIKPTRAFSGSSDRACATDCRSAASSSSTRHVSITKT
mmetsp:Transcript_13764/g.45514  ORF Transcript_13764/g.45514 Transcript_13764/m.45514 type:complete len:206 (-) Transcript_13764:588-1205(-)